MIKPRKSHSKLNDVIVHDSTKEEKKLFTTYIFVYLANFFFLPCSVKFYVFRIFYAVLKMRKQYINIY